MNADVINAVAALAWPVFAAIIIFALLPTLIRVLRSRGVSIKFGNMELSVQDASDQVRKQVEDLQDQFRKVLLILAGPAPTAQAAERLQSESRPESPPTKSILWVDDRPENNAFELAKLLEDGYDISTVESTRGALRLLESGSSTPDLIISDMGRQEGTTYRRRAGLDLIRAVRSKNIDVPILVYASTNAVRQYSDHVRDAGGNGITASPIELMEFIAGQRNLDGI